MGSWEVTQSAFIALIFLFFFIGFTLPDKRKYVAFKLLFLWLGFTLIMPFLWIQKLIADEHLPAVGRIWKSLFIVYVPLYTGGVYVLFVLFFKDVILFFKESIKGFKGSGEQKEIYDGEGTQE